MMAPHAAAQQASWPNKPVRIVVPYPAGSGPDIMAMLVAQRLANIFKSPFIVDNKAGANAIIGTDSVVKSSADGYTFLLVDRLTLSVNPLLYKPLPYDPRKDITSVSNIADVNLYLVVSKSLPVTDFRSFVIYAKSHPNQVSFGTGGAGSVMHLNMELLQAGAGIELLHVPYKGFAAVIPDLVAGNVQASSGRIEALQQFVADGKLRLLALGADTRSPLTPEVPTIMEASGGNYLMSTSYTLHAKTGTPPEVIAKLNKVIHRVLSDPEVRASTRRRGLNAYATTPAQLDKILAQDAASIGKLVRERNITLQ
jgi:tripartite-type tricarboxylate transporter receptor subunit TctC